MDMWMKRAVIIFLGCISLSGMLIGGWLAAGQKNIPDFIIGQTATATGALAGVVVMGGSVLGGNRREDS